MTLKTPNVPDSGTFWVILSKSSQHQPQIKVSGQLILIIFFTESKNIYQMWFMEGEIFCWQGHSMMMMMTSNLPESGTLLVNMVRICPLLDTLPIKISTQNFHDIFLGVKKGHPWHQVWPCPPNLLSGTFNVLQVPTFLTPPSWYTSNKDINTKLSRYLP